MFNIFNLYNLYISFQNSNCWQISTLYDVNIKITSREYYNNNDIVGSLCVFVSVCVLQTSTYNVITSFLYEDIQFPKFNSLNMYNM